MRILTPSRKAFLFGFLAGLTALVALQVVVLYSTNVQLTRGFYACQYNLCRVGNALQLYALNNEGFLPNSLEVLVREGLVQEPELRCPMSGKEYMYTLQGRNARDEGLPPALVLVMEHGFPHRLVSPADPRTQETEPLKQCFRHLSGWWYQPARYWWQLYEEDPELLRKVLGFPKELVPGPENEGPAVSSDAEQAKSGT